MAIKDFILLKTRELLQSSPKEVYLRGDLLNFYLQLKYETKIPDRITPKYFLNLLLKEKLLHEIIPSSPYPNPPKRYVREEFSIYELACSIRKGAYLSHGTAAFLHGLLRQPQKNIYVNKEQSVKPKSDSQQLDQDAIELAFSRKQRQSKYVLRYGKVIITVLSGKNTGRFGVQRINWKDVNELEATDIERTLIDITVRPLYAGGVEQVLQCYIAAKTLISPQKLFMTLKALDYVYPYHQAVGFYMQQAGFKPEELAELRKDGLFYDFYLAHGMKRTVYDSEWRIFFPKYLPRVH